MKHPESQIASCISLACNSGCDCIKREVGYLWHYPKLLMRIRHFSGYFPVLI